MEPPVVSGYAIPLPGEPDTFDLDRIIERARGIVVGPDDSADMYDSPFGQKVLAITDAIAEMLVTKNIAYGDSALNPVRIFSTSDTDEQLLVRIDDKLSRIARGHEYQSEDVIDDLIGYLIMLKIKRMED